MPKMRCLDRYYLILYIKEFEDTKNSLKIPKGQHTHKTKDFTLKDEPHRDNGEPAWTTTKV